MPYLLESGSGWLLAEDGTVLLLEGADSAGLSGTIAATSTLRIRGRLAGSIAATSTLAAGITRNLTGAIASTSTLRAVNVSILPPNYAADPAALAAGAAPHRQAWVTLHVDLGTGLQLIPNAAIGAGIMLTESLDQLADTLTFSLVGESFSPLINRALTGRQRVTLRLAYGADGAVFDGVVFDGHLFSASFDGYQLSCTAHDFAGQWVRKLTTPDIPAGSGRYRTEIAHALLASGGVSVGSIDLANNGNTIAKAVSYADVPLLNFAKDFLSPADAVLWCEQGRLHIASIAALVARAAIPIGRNMIARPLSIQAPPTTGANVVTAAAVKFTPQDLDGDGQVATETTVSVVETSAVYAPLREDAVIDAQMRVVSRVTTTTVTQGGVTVWQVVDEEGWYARHGGASQAVASAGMNYTDGTGAHVAVYGQVFRDGDGTIAPVFPYSGYRFPDGSLRADTIETFRLVRRTVTNRVLDTQGRVETESVRTYRWRLPEKAVAEVGPGAVETLYEPNVIPGGYVMLRDDGSRDAGPAEWSWQSLNEEPTTPRTSNSRREAWEDLEHSNQHDTLTLTVHTINIGGQIDQQVMTEGAYSRGAEMAPGVAGGYVYGATSKEYWTLAEDTRDGSIVITTTTYDALGEDSYRQTVTQIATGGAPTTQVSTVNGALPYPQQVSNPYESQEITATVTTALGVTLNGETTEATANEFCETVAELATVARAIVRDAAAIPVTFDMPLEAVVHKARMVTPALAEYGADVPMLVWSVSRNLSTFRQTVTARVYQEGTT